MLIIREYDNLFIIRFFKEYLDNINIYDKDNILNLFRDVLIKLKNKYNVSGYINIDVYLNDDYGIIMEVINLYNDGDNINVKVKFHLDSIFLYEINDYNDLSGNVYYYNGKFYSTNIDNSYDSFAIYKDTFDIINHSIKIS